jgi:predicted N-acetyltransferase YhbS
MAATPDLPEGLVLRPVTPPEFDRFHLAVERTFLSDVNEHDRERELAIFEFDRSLAVWDGDDPVATIAAYSLEMTLPGGPRPVAGVSQVSVQPTHRRRGLLRTLMTKGWPTCTSAGRRPSRRCGPPSRASTAGSATARRTGWPR